MASPTTDALRHVAELIDSAGLTWRDLAPLPDGLDLFVSAAEFPRWAEAVDASEVAAEDAPECTGQKRHLVARGGASGIVVQAYEART